MRASALTFRRVVSRHGHSLTGRARAAGRKRHAVPLMVRAWKSFPENLRGETRFMPLSPSSRSRAALIRFAVPFPLAHRCLYEIGLSAHGKVIIVSPGSDEELVREALGTTDFSRAVRGRGATRPDFTLSLVFSRPACAFVCLSETEVCMRQLPLIVSLAGLRRPDGERRHPPLHAGAVLQSGQFCRGSQVSVQGGFDTPDIVGRLRHDVGSVRAAQTAYPSRFRIGHNGNNSGALFVPRRPLPDRRAGANR